MGAGKSQVNPRSPTRAAADQERVFGAIPPPTRLMVARALPNKLYWRSGVRVTIGASGSGGGARTTGGDGTGAGGSA